MRGHVRKRSWRTSAGVERSSWEFVLDLAPGEDGKRRQETGGGFRTRELAEKALTAAKGALDAGKDPFPKAQTFAEYGAWWLDHHEVERSTKRRYEQLARLYLVPVLGGIRLDQITRAHVKHCLAGIDRAPATIRQTKAVLSSILATAVEDGLIPSNPAAGRKLAPPVPRPDLVTPTGSQCAAVLAEAAGTEWEIPVLLSISLGTRRGETLAVRWVDVDFDRGRVRIARSLEWVDGGARFKEPKSQGSRRTVTLPGFAVEYLRRHRSEQNERRLAAGPAWHDLGLVCDRGDGSALHPDTFSRAWTRLAKKAGVDGARLHDARHSVATSLLERGVPLKMASAMLGHSTTAITADTYMHVTDAMQDEAADAIGDALGWGEAL